MKNIIASISLLALVGCGDGTDSSLQETKESPSLKGVFYNTNEKLGGNWIGNLNTIDDNVTGNFNATQFDTAKTILCGAGEFKTKILNGKMNSQFISNDIDEGCTFDKGGIIKFDATVNNQLSHIIGNYDTHNSNGSSFAEGGGLFEMWNESNKPQMKKYKGTFTNIQINQDGTVEIDIAKGEKLVYGTINFTEEPGASKLCGAGQFTGIIENDKITFAFESDDKDQGCGFERGNHFEISADYINNQTTILGDYSIGNVKLGHFSVDLK